MEGFIVSFIRSQSGYRVTFMDGNGSAQTFSIPLGQRFLPNVGDPIFVTLKNGTIASAAFSTKEIELNLFKNSRVAKSV